MAGQWRVDRACWEGPTHGRVDLTKDWPEDFSPPLHLPEGWEKCRLYLTRTNPLEYAKESGYSISGEWASFVAPLSHHKEVIYLAGEFNGWQGAIGQQVWKMEPMEPGADGKCWAVLTVKVELLQGKNLFKFVTQDGVWRDPPHHAINVSYEGGIRNHAIDWQRTGAHVFDFEVQGGADWKTLNNLVWEGENIPTENVPLWPGRGFYRLHSDSPQGAFLEGQNRTRFRLFAPRATHVDLTYISQNDSTTKVKLQAERDGCWTTLIPQNLDGYRYYYTIDGPHWAHAQFDKSQKITDPWALAMHEGLSVVIDVNKLKKNAPVKFSTPKVEDLIIAEAHVRDLVAKAPLPLTDTERKSFLGVKKWLEWDNCPINKMGINAIELQPLTEYDGKPEDYAWGYMPLNFFAPASGYASDAKEHSQLRECQEMVEAFHKKNIAIIVDVVMNHWGVPTSPLFIDKAYYLRMNSEGGLTNWSGCGNDLRTESAIAEKMLLAALEHWVTAYGVDGFRFDLAELLGVNFLKKAETYLKKIKPDIILIAEPWSFRGHIAASLKDTSYTSWNDGYREFVPRYLRGQANVQAAKYFLSGSMGGVAARPVHSLNYVESHDDHTWIDKITENPGKNGQNPTPEDVKMTHLMASLLTMSLGVPMWHIGAEALRSKGGIGNTYLRGDINAIDWQREEKYPATVDYIRGLNNFRLSENGKALRVNEIDEKYLQFYELEGAKALGVVYNAQNKEKCKKLLYVINPEGQTLRLPLEGLKPHEWQQIANDERIINVKEKNEESNSELDAAKMQWKDEGLEIPARSSGIWVCKK